MARGKRRAAVEKDYDDLISKSKAKIEKLSEDLKAEKLLLKELEKDKVAYEKRKEYEEKQREQEELIEMIKKTERTPEEIRSFLFPEDVVETPTVEE